MPPLPARGASSTQDRRDRRLAGRLASTPMRSRPATGILAGMHPHLHMQPSYGDHRRASSRRRGTTPYRAGASARRSPSASRRSTGGRPVRRSHAQRKETRCRRRCSTPGRSRGDTPLEPSSTRSTCISTQAAASVSSNPNGAGKSTLLRILAGLEAPDRGTVRRLGTVGYLPQMADASEPRLSVRQMILERVGVAAASRELERWAATLQAGRQARCDRAARGGARALGRARWRRSRCSFGEGGRRAGSRSAPSRAALRRKFLRS